MAIVARLLLYVGVMVAIGDVCVQWVRADGWMSRIRPCEQRRPVMAWLAIMTALLLLFVLQFIALELAPTMHDVALLVRQTTWGQGWMVLAACALAGMCASILHAPLLVRASLALLLGVSMGGLGHAAADETAPLLSRALDALHVLGVGAWIGTLLCLALSPATVSSPGSWPRFSRLAVVAAPLAVLSGAGSALRRVNAASVAQVAASDYGLLLAGKIAIVLLILLLGAWHRRQVRSVKTPTAASVRLELVLACVVLGVTAVLTATAPPGE